MRSGWRGAGVGTVVFRFLQLCSVEVELPVARVETCSLGGVAAIVITPAAVGVAPMSIRLLRVRMVRL